ncbi:unnamed protein product [Discosporangium mesarthrocarpum]
MTNHQTTDTSESCRQVLAAHAQSEEVRRFVAALVALLGTTKHLPARRQAALAMAHLAKTRALAPLLLSCRNPLLEEEEGKTGREEEQKEISRPQVSGLVSTGRQTSREGKGEGEWEGEWEGEEREEEEEGEGKKTRGTGHREGQGKGQGKGGDLSSGGESAVSLLARLTWGLDTRRPTIPRSGLSARNTEYIRRPAVRCILSPMVLSAVLINLLPTMTPVCGSGSGSGSRGGSNRGLRETYESGNRLPSPRPCARVQQDDKAHGSYLPWGGRTEEGGSSSSPCPQNPGEGAGDRPSTWPPVLSAGPPVQGPLPSWLNEKELPHWPQEDLYTRRACMSALADLALGCGPCSSGGDDKMLQEEPAFQRLLELVEAANTVASPGHEAQTAYHGTEVNARAGCHKGSASGFDINTSTNITASISPESSTSMETCAPTAGGHVETNKADKINETAEVVGRKEERNEASKEEAVSIHATTAETALLLLDPALHKDPALQRDLNRCIHRLLCRWSREEGKGEAHRSNCVPATAPAPALAPTPTPAPALAEGGSQFLVPRGLVRG